MVGGIVGAVVEEGDSADGSEFRKDVSSGGCDAWGSGDVLVGPAFTKSVIRLGVFSGVTWSMN